MFSNRCYSNGRTSFRPALRLDEIDLPKKRKGPSKEKRLIWSFSNPLNQILIRIPDAPDSVQTRKHFTIQYAFHFYSKWDRHKGAAHANHDAAYVVTFAWGEDILQKPPFRHISGNFHASVHFSEQRERIMRWHLERAYFRKNKQWRNPVGGGTELWN